MKKQGAVLHVTTFWTFDAAYLIQCDNRGIFVACDFDMKPGRRGQSTVTANRYMIDLRSDLLGRNEQSIETSIMLFFEPLYLVTIGRLTPEKWSSTLKIFADHTKYDTKTEGRLKTESPKPPPDHLLLPLCPSPSTGEPTRNRISLLLPSFVSGPTQVRPRQASKCPEIHTTDQKDQTTNERPTTKEGD